MDCAKPRLEYRNLFFQTGFFVFGSGAGVGKGEVGIGEGSGKGWGRGCGGVAEGLGDGGWAGLGPGWGRAGESLDISSILAEMITESDPVMQPALGPDHDLGFDRSLE